MAALTPMMEQYLEIKKEYSDCILFYRLGDFYEMFFDDALKASKALEITLTGKDCGLEEHAPKARSAPRRPEKPRRCVRAECVHCPLP